MPTYQYRCSDCGQDLEVVQKFTDAALTDCPTCAGRLRKVYNAVGVVFKGSGFYSTDSRAGNGSKATANGSESAADKTSSDSSPSGSEKSSKESAGTSGSESGSQSTTNSTTKSTKKSSSSAPVAAS